MDPIALVLTLSAASAAMGLLGPLPVYLGRGRLPLALLGWANALAAGLMLGPAYLLVAAGPELVPLTEAAGAVIGIGFVWWTHRASGAAADREREATREITPAAPDAHIVVTHLLHSASEGVAIGAAMALSIPFGTLMAVAMAVHNVPESIVLTATLRARGRSWLVTTLLGGGTNVPQVLLAVGTFVLATSVPALLPWCVGFALGSLVYLVLSELLPECYRRAGRTTIALVTIVAMGIVVLLGGAG